jgi:glycosyltransferase involved in cell wall biosynthesis
MKEPLTIAINAQLIPDQSNGGIESVLIGLISALGKLCDGPEEYIIIGHWQEPEWLNPYIGPNQHIILGPRPSPQVEDWKPGRLEPFKRILGPLRPSLRAVWRELFPLPPEPVLPSWPEVPLSDGFYEKLSSDVIHFPWQNFVVCAIPSIYNPHDLQHLHYPQFFTPSTITRRETIYPIGCHLAKTVVVGSHWIKEDVVRQYHTDPNKIQVIPWAPPTQAYPEPSPELLNSVIIKYKLDRPFAFYPAMTWKHKNHIRLLEALAFLRDQKGVTINLVCTGAFISDHWPQIMTIVNSLNLGEQVQFLGMVSKEELRAIYRLAQFVVVPSLFEAASGPVFEAWQDNVPVTCSTVTSLPEQVGDAALLFDPYSVEAIADAVQRLSMDPILRTELVKGGQRRLQDFSWERTARAYRAVYRRAASYPLTEEDQYLLSWDWMRSPNSREELR